MMEEPLWMAKKEGLARMIEFYLMDAIREGLSQHLAGITPCNFIEFEKLMTPLTFALGNFVHKLCDLRSVSLTYFVGEHAYKDLNFHARFDPELKFRRVYNDDKVDKPLHFREHMFYLQSTAVFLTSDAALGLLKRWDGERLTCNSKGRKRMTFVGREQCKTQFAKMVLKAPWTFKGSESIPMEGWPQEMYNLWPLKTGKRTIFG